jgi:16S rRNA processing protein RimM
MGMAHKAGKQGGEADVIEELVSIARITKPKGLKGEVFADVLTDFPERFDNLESVLLDGDEVRELKLERFSFQKNRVVLKLKGIDSIEEADLLRNLDVCVLESDAVELDEDEFFDWDLEGCEVVAIDEVKIGIVKGVFRAGENVNLVVAADKKEHMIPFVKAICTQVDIESKRIIVDLPDGLLDF